MTNIGPVYPAQILVGQAEIRLVADQSSSAAPTTIKADEKSLTDAEEIETGESHLIDLVS